MTWDGERAYINFPNGKGIHTSALDASGRILWQRRIGDFVMHQGFGSSPVVYGEVVLVSADHRGGGVIQGLNRRTGEVVWSQDRPKLPNYTTPALIEVAGRTQAVLAGCNLITSLDPLTGKNLGGRRGHRRMRHDRRYRRTSCLCQRRLPEEQHHRGRGRRLREDRVAEQHPRLRALEARS